MKNKKPVSLSKLRDDLAGRILQGMLSRDNYHPTARDAALEAYKFAEALLQAARGAALEAYKFAEALLQVREEKAKRIK